LIRGAATGAGTGSRAAEAASIWTGAEAGSLAGVASATAVSLDCTSVLALGSGAVSAAIAGNARYAVPRTVPAANAVRKRAISYLVDVLVFS